STTVWWPTCSQFLTPSRRLDSIGTDAFDLEIRMPHPTHMSPADTGLLVIDVQDKLLTKIPMADALVRNVAFLVDGARLLNLPVQATEQYPKGLGPSNVEISKRIAERPEKTAFSCCAIPSVVEKFHAGGRTKLVLAGMETHVCVMNTALDLM